jgi:ribosomal peptide maturation radical SAM protein 1
MDDYDLEPILGEGDALIIVPPFAGLDRPSLAAHLLQACARREGYEVRVFYANHSLARLMDEVTYEAVCFAPTSNLLGERFFASVAYGVPPFGRDDPQIQCALVEVSGKVELSPDVLRGREAQIHDWVRSVSAAIAARRFPVVGCSTTFEQTAASVALLNHIKAARPRTITILGGANCEGEMAQGLLSLGARIDHIFSGESEETFPRFLGAVRAGRLPAERIIAGKPCRDLDGLPTPDFQEYFDQRDHFLPGSYFASREVAWLPYESSRGCWWGEKHHCTFCGINGLGMQFREKSADRVIEELGGLVAKHGSGQFCMVDNIMPHRYFQTLIPRLGREVPDLHLFYEQKANLTLDQVVALRDAGVAEVQPGIESLATNVLRLMDKGVSARQNIALLRYAGSAGIRLSWNLLYGFPGDDAADYRQTLSMLPLLRHLPPPGQLGRLSIDRFSPYFDRPGNYGIHDLYPMPSYASVLPPQADVPRIAYHFLGQYDSGSLADPAMLEQLEAEILAWQNSWIRPDTAPPALRVVALAEDQYVLLDSRELAETRPVRFLDHEEATAVLVARPAVAGDDLSRWAQEIKLAVELDGWHVPLATAEPELLRDFEAKERARKGSDRMHRIGLPVIVGPIEAGSIIAG